MPENLGPNTAASRDLLGPRVILCGGEDPEELRDCMRQLWPNLDGFRFFSYRCYSFWAGHGRTIILTGIGTGCLEPLLWEILQPGIVRDIILIGTSGSLSACRLPRGVAACITEAYSGCTSIDDIAGESPLRPRRTFPASLPTTSGVSTDYYYGFSQRGIDGPYSSSPALRRAVERHLHARDLVDMETAQFYWLCQTLGQPDLRYLAVRAAANDVQSPDEQLLHSQAALAACLRAAVELQDAH